MWYDPSHVVEALGHLINVSNEEHDRMVGTDLYHFDLVDVTRQVLQNMVDKLHRKLITAFLRTNREDFEYVLYF